jgi:hypothetical protein
MSGDDTHVCSGTSRQEKVQSSNQSRFRGEIQARKEQMVFPETSILNFSLSVPLEQQINASDGVDFRYYSRL